MIASVLWDAAVTIIKAYVLVYLGIGLLLAVCVMAGLCGRIWSRASEKLPPVVPAPSRRPTPWTTHPRAVERADIPALSGARRQATARL